MRISLNYHQRLNLTGLIGQQKGSVAELRLWWTLLDKLELSEQEKNEINFRVIRDNGYDIPTWDRHEAKVVEVELAPEELTKIKRLLEEWPTFRPTDRLWLEPLLAQLEVPLRS